MSNAPTISNRSKRFERGDAPTIELTERDLHILRALRRLRFADSVQLHSLAGGSKQKLLRRLKSLFGAGYVDRPRAQLAQLHIKGNRATVYALGRKGAAVLREHDDAPVLNWTLKNSRAGSVFVEHTILTSQHLIELTLAARARGIELIDHADLLPFMPEKTRKSGNPFLWRVDAHHDGKTVPLSVVPDRLFSLHYPDGTRQSFAMEVDTGSMPVTRGSLIRSSLTRKLHAYWAGHQARMQEERWGFKSFFVIFVVPENERLAHAIEAQREIVPNGSRLFLFTTAERMREHGALGRAYINGKGEEVALVA